MEVWISNLKVKERKIRDYFNPKLFNHLIFNNMSTKTNEKLDFLSEAEQIKVMGGSSESLSLDSGIKIYIPKGCGWKDCNKACSITSLIER